MKLLVAPDKFKGSLTAAAAARHVAAGVRRALPDAVVDEVPVADGGEGTVASALAAGFEPVMLTATGPIIGMGGSASTDGGADMLAALGARLTEPGGDLDDGGGPLRAVTAVGLRGLHPGLARAELTLTADVDNPLLGPDGAAMFAWYRELEAAIGYTRPALHGGAGRPRPGGWRTGGRRRLRARAHAYRAAGRWSPAPSGPGTGPRRFWCP